MAENFDIHIINLKGSNSTKKLDMSKLNNIRVTDQNASIFRGKIDINGDGRVDSNDVIDVNNDGIITGNEVSKLQQFLDRLDGRDSTVTAKDFKTGNQITNATAFEALNAIADQQLHWETMSNSLYEYNLDGARIKTDRTGDEYKVHKDGTVTVVDYEEGSKSVVRYNSEADVENQRPASILQQGEEQDPLYTTYEYKDNETITRVYTGENEQGNLESIGVESSVSLPNCLGITSLTGQVTSNVDYLSEEDYQNGTPNSVTYTDQNGTMMVVTLVPVEGKEGVYTASYVDGVDSEEIIKEVRFENGQIVSNEPETVEPETPEVTTPQNATYTVVKNDSLWKIAADYLGEGATPGEINTAMYAIADANGLTIENNGCMIHPGQQLTIPAEINKTGNTGTVDAGGGTVTGAEGASMAQGGSYTVVKGDTPAKIARNYLKEQLGYEPSATQVRIYYKEIMDLNGIKDARKLQIGQVLQMPTISPMKINLPEGVTNTVTPPPATISTSALEEYMNTTITPPSAQVPESYTLPDAYKKIHPEHAGKQGVKIGEQWFDFDAAGRITRVFDREPNKLNDEFDNASVEIYYKKDGAIKSYFGHEFNDQGQVTGCIKYNAQGKVTMFAQYSDWNAAGLPQCEDWFYADGTFQQREVVEYDENNQKVSESLSDSDGRFSSLLTYENGKQVQGLGIYTDSNGEKYITRYSDYNEEADNFTTGVHYELTGQRQGDFFWGNFEFDEQGRQIGYTVYNNDGTFNQQHVKEYTADGSKYKLMSYDANGNLTDVLWCDN
ncbi:MAG: LysM peptidoglycan-binding domain-containing protein [Cyanobacteria bacterium SIG26]|nr:LysM peptidoglycan-binding domain-containing protein [Cyanobacteria bacterium SIG26]